MANHFRRMPFAAKVDTLQAEIGRDQGIVAGRDSQDGAVVSDPFDEFGP